MLKIGQNWGKISNYPPNAQQRLAPLVLHNYTVIAQFALMLAVQYTHGVLCFFLSVV